MSISKNDKVAAITGAARGIGREIALQFANASYNVVICDIINKAAFDSTGFPDDVLYCACDISEMSDRQDFFSCISSQFGRLDVLVNNAGVAPKVRLDILETTEANFSQVIDINIKGTFFMCQAASDLLIKTAQNLKTTPYIINISSMSAYTSSVSRGEYCISKAGVSMITKLYADRLSEYGIPVFEIRPGIILTDMTEPVREKYQKFIDGGSTLIQRFGVPGDIAKSALALCSGAFDYSTGQSIEADGGFHVRRL